MQEARKSKKQFTRAQSANLGRTGSQVASQQQRQTKLKEEFEAAKEKFATEPCEGLVYDVAVLRGMLRGKFRDIPKDIQEDTGGSVNTRAKRLLLEPFKKGDAQHFIRLAKAINELNQISEECPLGNSHFCCVRSLIGAV